MSDSYVIPQPTQAAIAVAGSAQKFPVRRIWCVGRNYEEHIKEMGLSLIHISEPTRPY